ncbi:hypothetical protein OKW50_004081 [Paraburkholderia youngii]
MSVAERPVRSNSGKPSSCSSRCICALTADCVSPMRAPAPENVPYWLTAMKVFNSLSMIDQSILVMVRSNIYRFSTFLFMVRLGFI